MSKFKVGQKVVCIDPAGYLVQGKTYTITSMLSDGVTVKECSTSEGFDAYWEGRFCPVNLNVDLSREELLLLVELGHIALTEDALSDTGLNILVDFMKKINDKL